MESLLKRSGVDVSQEFGPQIEIENLVDEGTANERAPFMGSSTLLRPSSPPLPGLNLATTNEVWVMTSKDGDNWDPDPDLVQGMENLKISERRFLGESSISRLFKATRGLQKEVMGAEMTKSPRRPEFWGPNYEVSLQILLQAAQP